MSWYAPKTPADEAELRARISLALYVAAADGKKDLVERWLADGADPDYVTKHKFATLPMAATPQIARILIAGGASLELPDPEGFTPLARLVAARSGEAAAAVCLVLLEAGCNPHAAVPGMDMTAAQLGAQCIEFAPVFASFLARAAARDALKGLEPDGSGVTLASFTGARP